jgi:hypothetical protein
VIEIVLIAFLGSFLDVFASVKISTHFIIQCVYLLEKIKIGVYKNMYFGK